MRGRVQAVVAALSVAALLVMALLAGTPRGADAQSGVTNFTTVSASRDVVVGRDVQVGSDVLLGGVLSMTPATSLTVADNALITPTTSVMRLTAAAAVGISGTNIALGDAGAVLVLLNVGSNTITFTETGTFVSAGNIALGAGDSATLISTGTGWTQIAGSNN